MGDELHDQARKIGTGSGDYTEGDRTEQSQRVNISVGGAGDDTSKQRRDFRRILEEIVSLRNGGPNLEELLNLKGRYPQYRDDIEGAIQVGLIKNNLRLHRRVQRIEEEQSAIHHRVRRMEKVQAALLILIIIGIVCIMILQLAYGG